jgi:uncharacterized membrane protein YdjX (TVP38/TMEM64 family)
MRPADLLRRYGLLVLIAALLVAAYAAGLHRYLSFDTLAAQRDALRGFVAERPIVTLAAFLALYIAAAAAAIPGVLWLTILGGFLFGALGGGLAAVSSATAGAFILFLATRSAAGGKLRSKAGGFIDKLEKGFSENAFNYLLTLRLLPVAPFFMVNIAAGLLGVKARDFLIASFLGMIPGALVYASIGAGLDAAFAAGKAPDLSIVTKPEIILPLVGLAALSLMPVVWKALRKGKETA